MRCPQYTLEPHEVHTCAQEWLNEHLGLVDQGRRCTVAVVFHVLFFAAARLTSLFAACQRLRDAPSDDVVRKALVSQLPEIDELERRLQASLVAMLPPKLCRRRWPIAIDLTLIPYHGQPHRDRKEVYRGEAKSGTTHFHAYATAYLVVKGRRFTVALARVELGTPMKEVLRTLLGRVRAAGIRPQLLLLDRGFYSAEVVRYLQAARLPFLLPMPMRGRKATDPRGPSGTRRYAASKQSGWIEHTWVSADGVRATVAVCQHRCRRRRRGRQRGRRVTLVYACWGLGQRSTAWVRQTYRRRFGIETSYRQLHQGRARTSSRRAELRLLLVAIALLLRNVWVWLHWTVLAQRRRGHRRLQLQRLRLPTLLLWLQNLAETTLGIVQSLEAQYLE